MNWLSFLLLSLSVWRVTSLLVYEDGPYDIFDRIRYISGMKYNEFSQTYGTTVISKLLNCFLCTSLWVSLFVCFPLFFIINLGIYEMILYILSASSVSIIVDSYMMKLK